MTLVGSNLVLLLLPFLLRLPPQRLKQRRHLPHSSLAMEERKAKQHPPPPTMFFPISLPPHLDGFREAFAAPPVGEVEGSAPAPLIKQSRKLVVSVHQLGVAPFPLLDAAIRLCDQRRVIIHKISTDKSHIIKEAGVGTPTPNTNPRH